VGRSFRQTADSLHHFFPAQSAGCCHGSSLHQMCERRTASHGGNAAFGQKTDFRDMAVRNLYAQFQNIAASWIFDLHGCVRISQFARVARILKVIEKLRRIHPENCNVAGTRDVASYVSTTVETLFTTFSSSPRFSIPNPCKIDLSCLPTILPSGLSLCSRARP
jgi:hypothetical protein